jgi:Protein of unknown function (DUF3984)
MAQSTTPPYRHGTRPGRRSFPNLTHLSLAPLSSRFPIDSDGYNDSDYEDGLPKSSYIQGKSAPTTPGILAGSSKPRSKSKKSKYAHDSYFPSVGGTFGEPMTKSKSVGALGASLEHGGIHGGPESPLLSRGAPKLAVQEAEDEWLRRAGLVIASEMRESKGQSWLTSRESSTSLVQQGEEYDEVYIRQSSEDAILSRIHSRNASRLGSRAGSRVASARPSRRGSKSGSRVDFLTTYDSRTPGTAVVDSYFEEELAMEPDFVDNDDEEGKTADEEIKRLATAQDAGLGGFVDQLIGWSLFNVDEDSEDDEKIKAEETEEELQKRRQLEIRKRKEELARVASNSAIATTPKVVMQPPRQNQDQEGGWNDVAWLLSVASKVIL